MFIAAFAAGVWGLVFIYRKTKQKLEKIRDAISRVDLSDKNLELSFMGGVLTMRIEQNGRTPLLEAPSSSSAIIDAEPLESTAPR
jgi:hypothetical protein